MHRVEVAVEVEVDLLHRHDLRVAAAVAAALDAEDRAHARLAQAEHHVLADLAEPLGERDARRRLALAGLRGRDRGRDDQLAVGPVGEAVEDRELDLRAVAAVLLQLVGLDARRRRRRRRSGGRTASWAISSPDFMGRGPSGRSFERPAARADPDDTTGGRWNPNPRCAGRDPRSGLRGDAPPGATTRRPARTRRARRSSPRPPRARGAHRSAAWRRCAPGSLGGRSPTYARRAPRPPARLRAAT